MRIYLDQWAYVNLLKTYKGQKPYYPNHKDVCQKVIETANSGKHTYPLSFCHLFETHKRRDTRSRTELFKFILDISKFNSIIPWTHIIDLEIRNAIIKTVGKTPVELSNAVFGRGIGHCFGAKEHFTSIKADKPVPKEILDKCLAAMKNSEMMANALGQTDSTDFVKRMIERDSDLAANLEKLRSEEYGHPDKEMRKKISEVRFLLNVIRDKFLREVLSFNLNAKALTKQVFGSKETSRAFLRSIPTAYVYYVLNSTRNLNKGRAIEPNDLYDFGALNIAVPYCDVVVTEREWAKILIQRNVDKFYNTRILHSLDELGNLL
ncbi:hypothetical protein HYX10_04670 [Candidatus Woesearchaeota archaeon]|nr:hypothetical protein [Candidatus Woesearchaeota archaeon]